MQIITRLISLFIGICCLFSLFPSTFSFIPASVHASIPTYRSPVSQTHIFISELLSSSMDNETETNNGNNSDLSSKPFPTARTSVIVVVAILIFAGFALFVYMNRDKDR